MRFTNPLRTHRANPRGLADLLPYDTFLGPGTLLLKDGSFLAAFSFRGPDIDSLTPEQIDAQCIHVTRALNLGNHWMCHFDAVRRTHNTYPTSVFHHPTLALLDEERRARYSQGTTFETSYFLTLTHHPHNLADQLFSTLFGQPSATQSALCDALALFDHRLLEIEDALSPLQPQRLGDAELLAHLHACITHTHHPIATPTISYIDQLLADQHLVGGNEPRIGDLYIGPIAITALPQSSQPAMLRVLDTLPFSLRWSTRFLTLDGPTAGRLLQKLRLQWSQARTPLLSYLLSALKGQAEGQEGQFARNPHAEEMTQDANDAMNAARAGSAVFGFFTTVVLLFDDTPAGLAARVRETLKSLRFAGFPCRLETLNALDAYLGSLPGVGHRNIRKALITTTNVTHIGPFTSTYSGSPRCPSPLIGRDQPALLHTRTSTGDPFRLNLHVDDVGHFLLVGPTGAGKTTALALIAAQFFRYPGSRVIAFDRGYGLWPLVSAAGGSHYDLGVHGTHFYPLSQLGPEHFSWATDYLESLFALNGITVTPAHRAAITDALQLLAQAPPNSRTLEHLRIQLQHDELRTALIPYTGGGPYASLLDADTDTLEPTSRFHVFEVGNLLGFGANVLVPVLLCIFRKCERLLDGAPTLILLEEAWALLGQSLFAGRIGAWLKTLRKQNAAVGFVTQSIGDLDASPIAHILYESCPTKLFLANPEASSPNGSAAYSRMGLNTRQIETIAKAVPKKEYYLSAPTGSRLFQLDLTPVQLAFFGAGSAEHRARIHALQRLHGDLWPAAWLRENQQTAAATYLETTIAPPSLSEVS